MPGTRFTTSVQLPPNVADSVIKLIAQIPCCDDVLQTIGIKTDAQKLALLGRTNDADQWTGVAVEGAAVSGKSMTVYLNRNFLSKALSFGLTDIRIIDAMTPVRFINGNRQMVVMPMRVDSRRAPATAKSAVSSAPEQPTERSNMSRTTNTNGQTQSQTNGQKPAVESALEKIEAVKQSCRQSIQDLNGVADSLKQIQREQRSSEREVQSVRSTLEKLQSVKI